MLTLLAAILIPIAWLALIVFAVAILAKLAGYIGRKP